MRGGFLRSRLAHVVVTGALAMIGAGPALAERRGVEVRPGSGVVKRDGPAPRRTDSARQAAAQAKRKRKGRKRLRDWHKARFFNLCMVSLRERNVHPEGLYRGE